MPLVSAKTSVESRLRGFGNPLCQQDLATYEDPSYVQNLIARQDDVDRAITEAVSRQSKVIPPIGPEGSYAWDFAYLRDLRRNKDTVRKWVYGYGAFDAVPLSDRSCRPGLVQQITSLLTSSRDIARQSGTQIVVVFIPSKDRVDGTYKGDDFCFDTMKQSIASQGFQSIDIDSMIRDKAIPASSLFYFNDSIHFSPSGHVIIADLIASSLK